MIEKNEAILILQMLAGAKADPNQPDYIETCTTIKSLNDKCVAVVNQAVAASEEKLAASGKALAEAETRLAESRKKLEDSPIIPTRRKSAAKGK